MERASYAIPISTSSKTLLASLCILTYLPLSISWTWNMSIYASSIDSAVAHGNFKEDRNTVIPTLSTSNASKYTTHKDKK